MSRAATVPLPWSRPGWPLPGRAAGSPAPGVSREAGPAGTVLGAVQEYADRHAWTTLVVASLFFYALIFPYRSIHLGQPLMVVMGLAFALVSAKFAMDQFFLLLVLFNAYATFQKVLPGDFGYFLTAFNLTNVMFAFTILGLLFRAREGNRALIRVRPIDLPLVAFAFISSLSLILGELRSGGDVYSGHVVFALKRWLEPLFIYLVAVNAIQDRRDNLFLTAGVAFVAALIGIRGVKEWYLDKGGLYGAHYGNIDRARISVQCDNPNQLGAYLCNYSFYLAAIGLMARRWWTRVLGLVGFVACGRAMLLTFSRGTTLAFACAGVMLVLLWNRKAFLLVLVPLLVYFSFFPQQIPGILVGRFSSTFTRVDPEGVRNPRDVVVAGAKLDESSVGRLAIWQYGIEIIKENPLFGVGFGRFRLEILKLSGGTFDSHNTYLTIAAEMGLPALALFLSMLWLYSREAYHVWRASVVPFERMVAVGYLAGIVGMAVSNVFGFRLNSNEVTFHYWIMTAVIVRMAEFVRSARPAEEA
ncbi:MAG: O-antigen ligase family protein [Planctomycetes bacterium]|nr:O-antigen ligase family protein [Planctomycetota bacterium]